MKKKMATRARSEARSGEKSVPSPTGVRHGAHRFSYMLFCTTNHLSSFLKGLGYAQKTSTKDRKNLGAFCFYASINLECFLTVLLKRSSYVRS